MWSRFFTCCCLALVFAAPLAADMQDSAWRARDLLGPDRWAQVLKIENSRGSAQPPTVYALVFELEGRLWIYAENRGTESLSTHRDRLEQDKADLGPLLRNIDPGFTRFSVLRTAPPRAANARVPVELPNGCFIESVAFLRSLVATGRTPDQARLLAYYGINGPGHGGHTILYYERHGQRFFYDPAGPATPLLIAESVRPDALAIAQVAAPKFDQRRPERAVFLPLRVPAAFPLEWSDRQTVASNTAIREPSASLVAN
jgi:hypothetical protein